MKKNKKTKKILAIIALAFGGALAATSILSPFIFKNWKQIQYDIIELNQDTKSTTDDSVNFDFSFNDAQTGELNGKDIKVSLYEVDGDGKRKSTAAQVGLAKFNQLYRKWVYSGSDLEQKLLAGTKYEIVFSSASSGITKENLQFNTSAIANNYVFTKANVSSFKFDSTSGTEQKITVTFGDNQKTLENKKAILKYFYTSTNNDKNFRNDESRSQEEVEIKNGQAVFTLSGLQPSRRYTIEYVAILEESNNGIEKPREIEVAYAKSINPSDIEGGSTFKTADVSLTASSFEAVQVKENTADILIGFKKTTNEADFSLTGKEATLVYRRKGSSEQKEISARVVGDVVNFRFDGADEKSTLQEGSFFIVDAVKVQDSQVEWKSDLQDESKRTFQTALAVSKVEFKNFLHTNTVMDLEFVSQDNKDQIDGKEIQVSFSPLLPKVPAKTVLKLKEGTNDTYVASVKLDGLSQGQDYTLDRVKIKVGDQDVNIPFALKYRGDEGEKARTFVTLIDSVELALQGSIVPTHSNATLTLVFSPEYSFINGKNVKLKYKRLNPASDQVFEAVAEGKAGSLVYDLSKQVVLDAKGKPVTQIVPLQSGSQYVITEAVVEEQPNLKFVITTPQNKESEKQFATFSTIKSISATTTDTTATVKIAFEDNLNTLPKVDGTTARKAKIVYRPIDSQIPPISTALVELADDNTVTFELNGLLKGFKYEIESIQFDHALDTFYAGNLSTLPNEQNKFSTTATSFELKSVEYSDQKETSAKGSISFDLSKDLVLVGKTINVYYKDATDTNAVEQKIENITIDDLGVASINFSNLAEGKKYQITRIESADASLNYNFSIPAALEAQNHFFTKAVVSAIEIPTNDITENSAKINFSITNADDQLITSDAKFKVSYLSADGISGSMEKTITKAEFDSKLISVDLTNLAKDTTYTIDKLYLNGEEIKRTTTFVEEQNTFKTPAQTVKVLGMNQISNTNTEITFEFNFDNVVDAYADGKELKVGIKKDNSQEESKFFNATVQNGIVSFDATGLDAGNSYTVESLEFVDPTIAQATRINFADNLLRSDRKIYTSEIIKSFAFENIGETSAEVVINFGDPQNKFNGKHISITLVDSKNNLVELNSTQTDPNVTIADNTFRMHLTGLTKFTEFSIQGVKVDVEDNNYQDIAIAQDINKSFMTKALNVQVAEVVIEDITTTSAKAIYRFKDEDDYLKDRQVTIKLSPVINGEETTKTVTITERAGNLEAEFDLSDLLEGKKYKISGIDINDIESITDDTKLFNTLPVVKNVKALSVSDQQATIEVVFQNEDEDQAKTFNGKEATIKFINETNGGLEQLKSTVTNNRAVFTLTGLSKVTKYDLNDISVNINNANVEVPLDKLFTNENQEDRIKNFTTTSSSARVVSILDDAAGKTKNSARVTFQFDRQIDGFIAGKSLSLVYRSKQDGSSQVVSAPSVVDQETNAVTFDLSGLEEGGAYTIEALNSSDNINVIIPDEVQNRDFATLAVVSSISYNVPSNEDSDTKIGIDVHFDDRLSSLNGKQATIFVSSKTSGSQATYTTANNVTIQNGTISFQLENLEKKNTFLIEDVLVDGKSIDFKSTINSLDNEQRTFTTTAKVATVKSISVLETTKESSSILISFDPAKDWFVIGKKVKIFFRRGKDANDRYETVVLPIDSEGNINATIVKQTLENSKELISGTSYDITEIQIQENTDNTTVKSAITVENKPDVLGTFNTSSTINSVEYANKTENSVDITIGLQTEDDSLQTSESYIQVVNNINGVIRTVKSNGTFNSENKVTYNLTGLEKDNKFTVLGISIKKADGTLLDFTKNVANSDKNFTTTPTSATVTNITYKWLNEEKTRAIVKFDFDSNIDSFLNGRALQLTYRRITSGRYSTQEIKVNRIDDNLIKVSGSSIQFTLEGKVNPLNGHSITNNNIIEIKNVDDTNYQVENGESNQVVVTAGKSDTPTIVANAVPSLILGSQYEILSLKTVELDKEPVTVKQKEGNAFVEKSAKLVRETNEIQIHIPTGLQKTFRTPPGVLNYQVDQGGIVDAEEGNEFNLIGRYVSDYNITTVPLEKIKVVFANQVTGKFEEFPATEHKDLGYGLYKIVFRLKTQKQSRYVLHSTVINGEVATDESTNKERFSTINSVSTVTDIEQTERTKTTAKVSIGFVSADENLLRMRVPITVEYRKQGSDQLLYLRDQRVNANTQKLELEFTGLEEGTSYEITNVTVNGMGSTSTSGPVTAHNSVIKQGVHKLFSTQSVISQIVNEGTTETSTTLKVVLQGDTTYINNEPAVVTLVKLDSNGQETQDTSTYTTAADSNYDSTTKQAKFTITGLEKLTGYKVLSIAIGPDVFEWKAGVEESSKHFITEATNATVSDIQFSNIVDKSAALEATISAADGYMAGRMVKVVYKELDAQGAEIGQEFTSTAAQVSEDLKLTYTLTNLKTASSYKILRFELEQEGNKPNINITTSNTKFDSYSHLVSITADTQEQSASLTLTFDDRLLPRIQGKLVRVELEGGKVEYASINAQKTATFVFRNLEKETEYRINHIILENRDVVEMDGFSAASKTFITKGTTATITSITKGVPTTNSAQITIRFADIDKYLITKNAKLKYKVADNTSAQEQTSTNPTAITAVQGQPNTGEVVFNLANLDVQSGTKYEILGLEVANREGQNINFSFAETITNSTPQDKFFETKVAQPTIISAEITETTNTEGLDNTYLSKLVVKFNDQTNALNLNLLNSWDFQLKNNNSGSEAKVDEINFINRSYTRDDATHQTTVTVYINGDAEKWAAVDNKLEIKYKYFDDIAKTNSVDTDFVGQNENSQDLVVKTEQKYILRELKGYVASGFDMQFNLRVYDPLNLLAVKRTKITGYTRNDIRGTGNTYETISSATDAQPTGNGQDDVFIDTRVKKTIMNLKGYRWNTTASDNLIKWEDGLYTPGNPVNLDNLFPEGKGSLTTVFSKLDQWKFSTASQQWTKTDSKYIKKLQYIVEDTTNSKYKLVGINVNDNDTNYLIAKLLNINLDNVRIKNTIPLIARKSPTIWSNYQTPNLTGSGISFAGSLAIDNGENQPRYKQNTGSAYSDTELVNRSRWTFALAKYLDNTGEGSKTLSGTVDNSFKNNIGIKGVEYNQETGKLDFKIHLPELAPTADGTGGPEVRNFDPNSETSQVFALLVNDNGDIYLVGNSAGNGINFINDLKFNDARTEGTLEFDLKAASVPEDQRPKEGEKLRVAALLTNFTSANVSNPRWEYIFPFNWVDFTDAYKEIVYKK
ncbi:DUF1410 domain-containing protein [Mycoplasma procyoni]|uniref:DUF1410 domain-containing protein n=1 Tax=Mycoplasma procyoni TaxID=568784 RepID=UPI00197C4A3F|nr:DUF1410 domain-containing protein [Mycoplasma procyoni]MBN3534952.1 DUF1410 domain-containing protein [Mycoplasma procyoni]